MIMYCMWQASSSATHLLVWWAQNAIPSINVTFLDTAIFNFNDEATSIWMLPTLVLRRMILTGLNIGGTDPEMEDAKEFVYEGLKTFEHSDLASRLTLSSLSAVVTPKHLHDLPVTIIDVFDDCSLTQV